MQENIGKLEELKRRVLDAHKILNLGASKEALLKLERESAQPDFWNDRQRAEEVMQKIAELSEHISRWEGIEKEISEDIELARLSQNDLTAEKQIAQKVGEYTKKFEDLELELLFDGGHDNASAILSIHAGAGGTDAQDWAEMLLRMYLRFAEKNQFKTSILDRSDGEEAGLKSVTIEVTGHKAYGLLKSEHGVHRLVRLSPFNSDNLRQTSFAQVEVIPVTREEKLEIKPDELKIDTFRAGGHGGQSVNTTDSAVRITHIPSKISVSIQNERSQLQNKETAMKVLTAKLSAKLRKDRETELQGLKGERKSAEWGSQIRSYVLHPYQKIKDHRTGCESSDVTGVLDGSLSEFIEAYLKWQAKRRRT